MFYININKYKKYFQLCTRVCSNRLTIITIKLGCHSFTSFLTGTKFVVFISVKLSISLEIILYVVTRIKIIKKLFLFSRSTQHRPPEADAVDVQVWRKERIGGSWTHRDFNRSDILLLVLFLFFKIQMKSKTHISWKFRGKGTLGFDVSSSLTTLK